MSFHLFGRTFYFLSNSNQQQKALYMLKEYLLKPQILVLVLILLVYFLIRCYARVLKKEKLRSILMKISPWVYLLIILGVTLFNRGEGVREVRIMPDSWLAGDGRVHESAILGFMFNMALYMPFGYLLYKYTKNKFMTALSIVFVSSVLIEAMQFIFARGVTATDDLLANTAGGLIGVGFALLVRIIKNRKSVE